MKKNPIVAIMIYFILPLHGMEPAPIMDNSTLAWHIALTHGVQWFNYTMIHSLVISKKHETILCQTAEHRKQYLMQIKASRFQVTDTPVWHKFGVIVGNVRFRRYSSRQELTTERYYLSDCNSTPVFWSSFDACLPHQPQGFFNDQSDFCFYGYDESVALTGTVMEYRLRPNIKPYSLGCKKINCATNIPRKKSPTINLEIFLEFPALLKAFLTSSVVYEQHVTDEELKKHRCNGVAVYAIEGVTIPEKYWEYKQYFVNPKYHCFAALPRNIKKTILSKYKTQQKQK